MTPKERQAQLTPDFYRKQMPKAMAEQQANQLGVSQDDMFKLYSAIAQSQSPVQYGAGPGTQSLRWDPDYLNQGRGSGGTTITQPALQALAAQQLQNRNVAQTMGWFQPPPQQAAPQFQMPQLGPAQPMPTLQTQTLTPRGPYGAMNTALAPVTPTTVPTASAQQTTSLFNPLQQPQPQQFQGGGLVQNQPRTPFQQDPSINPQLMGPGDPSAMSGYYNPENVYAALGSIVTGTDMVTNPQPSGTPNIKSGVSGVGGARVWQPPADVVSPGKSYYQLPSGAMVDPSLLGPADIAELQKGIGMGTVKYTQATVAQGGPQGPQNVTPGLFMKAPLYQLPESTQAPLTARTPANAAQMPAAGPMPTYAQQTAAPMPAQFNYGNVSGAQYAPPPAPTVTAPAMPQVQPSFLQAHTSALAEAGKAMYAHFGGDPSTATPADIANFHGQLQGAIAGIPPAQPAGGPQKKEAGGVVQGRSGPDQVPAMLTAGEFVVNKDAVKNIGVGNLEAMNRQRYQDGGYVTPYMNWNDPYLEQALRTSGQRREVPRTMSTAQQAAQQPAPAVGSGSPATGSNYWDQRGLVGTSPGAGQSGYIYQPSYPAGSTGQGPAWQGYTNRMGALGTNTYQAPAGSSALTVGNVAGGAAVPGAGVTQSLGQAPATGGNIGGAISSLGQGLAAAAQKYADSVKPWQMQADAVAQQRFGPPVAPSRPAAQFAQEQVV